jgi:hypothetical protein
VEIAGVKTVEMLRDHDHRSTVHRVTAYKAGRTYDSVPEMHARAIVAAGAGRIVSPMSKDQ